MVKTITETSTTDTIPGIGRWYYAVTATNKSGTSEPSNYDFIDIEEEPPPSSPDAISGYPVYFIGIFSIVVILIIYKKKFRVKQIN